MTPVTAEQESGTAIQLKENKAVEQALRAKISAIAVIEVTDAATFQAAGENKKAIVAIENAWTDYWEPLRVAARSVVDMILEKKKGPLDDLAKKKEAQVAKAKKWFDEQERLRMEAERKAQEAARKQAEDDALAAATALEKEGTPEAKAAAEEIIQAPVSVAQVVVKSTVPAGFGGMTQKRYSAEVVDIKALAKAVLEGKVPVQAIQGNEVFLNGQARMLKETMAWPGVRVNVR